MLDKLSSTGFLSSNQAAVIIAEMTGMKVYQKESRLERKREKHPVMKLLDRKLTGARDRIAVIRVPDGHGQPHVVTGRAREAPLLGCQGGSVDPAQVDSGSRR